MKIGGLLKTGAMIAGGSLLKGLVSGSGKSSNGTANKSILRYPYDIMDAETDYFLIEAIKYEAGGTPTIGGPVKGSFAKLKGAQSQRNFILPIPNGIGSVNNVGWQGGDMNALVGTGVQALSSGLDKAVDSDGGILKAIKDGSAEGFNTAAQAVRGGSTNKMKNYFRDKATAAAINLVAGSNLNASQIMQRNSGQIINQNLELLFNGVSLRPFQFGWDISPRDGKEAKVVKEMLMQLKMRSSPKRTQGDMAFLESPDVFRISYRKGSNTHPFLNKFKICALTSVGVNYTGSGQYSTYGDQMGTPVHMKLNLSFKELEPIYREDYEEEYIDF